MDGQKVCLFFFVLVFLGFSSLSVFVGFMTPKEGCYCTLEDGDGDLCCNEDESQALCPGECVCTGGVHFINFQISHICRSKTYGYGEDAILATAILGFIAAMGLAGSLCAACNVWLHQEYVQSSMVTIVQMQPQPQPQPPVQGHPQPMYVATGYPVPDSGECYA